MKPLGYKCRHMTPACACCDPSGQRIYRRTGKRRDRMQARRMICQETRGGQTL